jgi:hypothetical protein
VATSVPEKRGVYVPVAPLHRPGRSPMKGGPRASGCCRRPATPLTARRRRRDMRDVDCTMRRLMVLILAFNAEVGWLCRC